MVLGLPGWLRVVRGFSLFVRVIFFCQFEGFFHKIVKLFIGERFKLADQLARLLVLDNLGEYGIVSTCGIK